MSQSSASVVLPTKTKTLIPDWRCITDNQWEKTSQLWTIKRFKEYHCKVNKRITSTRFIGSTYPDYRWYLTIKTNNLNLEVDYIGIFLDIEIDDEEDINEIFVNVSICLLDGEGNVAVRRQTEVIFTSDKNQHGYPYFISKKELFDPDPNNKLLIDDTLTVFCQLECAPMNEHTNVPQLQDGVKLAISDNLPKGLERLLRDQTFVDVTFVVDGKKFGALKGILAARSPVFEAMFKHDMQENRSNQVNISDIRPEVFEEFLLFMYTDKTPNYKMVTELFVVADKYQVEGLKVLCEEIIVKELSLGNAIDLLLFADLHGAERLRRQVISFIKTNHFVLTSIQTWKNAILKRPHLFDLVNGVYDVQRPIVSSQLQVPSSSDTSIQRKRKR